LNARASVVAEAGPGGNTRLSSLRSEAPLALRPTSAGLYLVGTAAGPVGGDRLELDIDVGACARLTIRSAAASLVFPGRGPSLVDVRVRIGAGASLEWLVEPLVAIRDCRHVMQTRVIVETGGRLLWREELVVGRHGEKGGSVTSRMAVDVGGKPVLRQELALDGEPKGWESCAVGAGARSAGSVVIVEPTWAAAPPPPAVIGRSCVVMPLVGPAAQITALARDAPALRHLLHQALVDLEPGRDATGKESDGNAKGNAHIVTTPA
jgi:urease accessory protein